MRMAGCGPMRQLAASRAGGCGSRGRGPDGSGGFEGRDAGVSGLRGGGRARDVGFDEAPVDLGAALAQAVLELVDRAADLLDRQRQGEAELDDDDDLGGALLDGEEVEDAGDAAVLG